MAEADTEVLDTPGGDSPEPSRADDIGAAIEQLETGSVEPVASPQGGTAAPGAAASSGDRARGPDGKFISQPDAPAKPLEKPQGERPPELGAKATTPAAAQQRQAAERAAASQAAPVVNRAPATWKPQAREFWGQLPPDVQAEVTRRETEVGRALQESARAREAFSHVQAAIAPFAHNIQASGGDAIGTIQNLLGADNTLRHGATAAKAQLVADIIKNYGVDIQALDNVLAGQAVTPDPNEAMATALERKVQAQLQPVMQFFQQMQGRQQQAYGQITQEAVSDVEAFGQDPAHEFYEDVRTEMADIIDLYTQRGQQISLQQAYDRAIMLNPQIAEIVSKRAEAERVNKAAQAAQRARRTAASLSSSPAPAGSPGPAGDDRRAAIEAAFEASSGG